MKNCWPRIDAWLRRYRPGLGSTIVCFPHAGGSANFFLRFSKAFTEDTGIVAVQYPGRQDRLHEPAIPDIQVLADQIYDVLKSATHGPVVLVGHSMGATVGFEVARRMEADQPGLVRALVVSSQQAPSLRHIGSGHRDNDDQLLQRIRTLHADAAPPLTDPRVTGSALSTIRGDLRAIENYRYVAGEPLSCDITAIVGDADPLTRPDAALGWREHTTGRFELHVFAGGHFQVLDHRDAWADLVRRAV